MIDYWDNRSSLGQLVLSLKEDELRQVTTDFNLEQMQYIKDAANSQWKPGCNRDGDFNGERCEIWEVNQSRDIKVRSRQSGNTFMVKRGNLRPWLGI
jgi:putative DNA primase/helicase